MNEQQWLVYYRSRATGGRLLFRKEEILRVDRDGWWARVILKNGAMFRVKELEPEAVLKEKEKPAEKGWHCPDCDERYTAAELGTTEGGQPACPECGHEVGTI